MTGPGHQETPRFLPLASPMTGMARKQTRHGGGTAGPLCAMSRHASLFDHLVGSSKQQRRNR
jgi:hypothetical protein